MKTTVRGPAGALSAYERGSSLTREEREWCEAFATLAWTRVTGMSLKQRDSMSVHDQTEVVRFALYVGGVR